MAKRQKGTGAGGGVFRKHRGANKLSQKWYVEFRDHLERLHRTPAFTDRKTSEEYLRQLRRLVDVRANNLAVPKDLLDWLRNLQPSYVERIVNHFGLLDGHWLAANESLTAHVDAWCEYIAAKGRGERHVELYRLRVRRLLAAAGVERWNQLTPDRIRLAWLGLTPLTNGTRNHYLVALKAFCRWMERTGRAATNPTKEVEPLPVTTRKERKPFSAEEFGWLLSVTEKAPTRSARRRDGSLHYEVTGPGRALVYLFAVETGLRLGELLSLRVCDFALDGERPCVRLRAASAKNRKEPPPLPLRQELVAPLRVALGSKLPLAPALNAPGRLHTARVIRADMADARAEWIAAGATPEEKAERARSDFLAPVDHRGRVADFHALRATTATWLAEAGVSPYAMQQLMRHADIKTTMAHYAKVRPDVTRAALEQLPALRLTGA